MAASIAVLAAALLAAGDVARHGVHTGSEATAGDASDAVDTPGMTSGDDGVDRAGGTSKPLPPSDPSFPTPARVARSDARGH